MENATDRGEERTAPRRRAGEPERPLFEALLFFALVWLRGLLPLGSLPGLRIPAQASPADALWHLGILAGLVPAGLFLLHLIDRSEGYEAFHLPSRPGRPLGLRPSTFAGALALAGLAWLLALLPALLDRAAGGAARLSANPLLAGIGAPDLGPALFIPLLLASCLATGLVEELYFRVYLLRRLGQAGLGPGAALVFSSLLFGLAHGSQGPVGALVAACLGALFALRWRTRGDWAEISLGHGLYDFTALVALLYL